MYFVWATILVLLFAAAAALLALSGKFLKRRSIIADKTNPGTDFYCTDEKFQARVTIINDENSDDASRLFSIEIRGGMHAREGTEHAILKVFVSDITQNQSQIQPVYARDRRWQSRDSEQFCGEMKLGKIEETKFIDNWMKIIDIPVDCLELPRQGPSQLYFEILIKSAETAEEIAYANTNITYDNTEIGYLDEEEKVKIANTLAVPLAYTFINERNLTEDQQNIINSWIKMNAESSAINFTACKLHIIKGTLISYCGFLRTKRNRKLANKIAVNAPLLTRYNVLGFCMRIIEAGENICTEQIEMLKETAHRLGVKLEKLRDMVEDIHPFYMYQVDDTELSLGITADMNREQIKSQLSIEYSKWNSRVINSNPEIRSEAKYMLEKIGEIKTAL